MPLVTSLFFFLSGQLINLLCKGWIALVHLKYDQILNTWFYKLADFVSNKKTMYDTLNH